MLIVTVTSSFSAFRKCSNVTRHSSILDHDVQSAENLRQLRELLDRPLDFPLLNSRHIGPVSAFFDPRFEQLRNCFTLRTTRITFSCAASNPETPIAPNYNHYSEPKRPFGRDRKGEELQH